MRLSLLIGIALLAAGCAADTFRAVDRPTGQPEEINQGGAVYPGAVHEHCGNRKPPSAAYATPRPPLHIDEEEGIFFGGNFWDGRATGWLLGQPAAEQAQGPFLNRAEHNLPDAATVVAMVCAAPYGDQFRSVFGTEIYASTFNAYNAIGQALFAYENSLELNAFSSKDDHFLRDPQCYPLTEQERRGLALFVDEDKGKCAECHPSDLGLSEAEEWAIVALLQTLSDGWTSASP
jgi:cytochrome c peroxidase